MARTKFGSIITDIRGSIGGHTFTNGSSGTFIRTKVKPVSRFSSSIQRQRDCILTLAAAWKNLSAEERETWMTIYTDYTFTNSLGKVYTVSPYALFQALNTPLVLSGRGAVTHLDYPSSKDMTPFTVSVTGLLNAVIKSTVVQGSNDLFLVYCSQVFSPGSRVGNIKWRLFDCVDSLIVGNTALPLLSTFLQSYSYAEGSRIAIDLRYSEADVISSPSNKQFIVSLGAK